MVAGTSALLLFMWYCVPSCGTGGPTGMAGPPACGSAPGLALIVACAASLCCYTITWLTCTYLPSKSPFLLDIACMHASIHLFAGAPAYANFDDCSNFTGPDSLQAHTLDQIQITFTGALVVLTTV